ncbi:Kinesin motor domain [Trypanosoma melophagium]|uniref:Kinesin motor domain n=1 Tax=Trypanosoma melophagium TaxID=715481 RepID=UPI00351AA811|nr:Kinesin motor domain [Trypanosoma melophagium]
MSRITGDKRSSIDVLIRVRPMRAELNEVKSVWDISTTTLREKGNPDSLFTFDHVYNSDATTRELYERSVRRGIVANVAKGYNGTVFAYGQTGSGKTHTMLGENVYSNSNSCHTHSEGLVAMSVRDLFNDLEEELRNNPSMQITVFLSMVEIYNEQLRDLLLASGATALPLSIRENEYGVYVHNAVRRQVSSAQECTQVIHTQAAARVSANTTINEQSSRSHCVIRILVEKTILIDDTSDVSSCSGDDMDAENSDCLKKKIVSTLNLIDLAGSERVAKSGLTGMRRVEGGYINKSLTILTTVISRLSENNNYMNGKTIPTGAGGTVAVPAFVPYRDSRLTHLLKTAIGGNSLTAVFFCITPAMQHVDESRSTLQFAARVKSIKNKVSVNEVADPRTKLREMEISLRRYRRMMVATTIYLWSKNIRIKNMQDKIDELILLLHEKSGVDSNLLLNTTNNNHNNSNSNSGSIVSPGKMIRSTPNEQQRIIIERLTEQNEMLQEELVNVRSVLEKKSNIMEHAQIDLNMHTSTAAVTAMGVADDHEKQQLRSDLRDLEQMLKEVVDEKNAIQQSMDELDSFCKELEDENTTQASTVKTLKKKCRELQTLIDAKGEAETSANAEVNLLKEQLAKTQQKLMEKSRGDDYLQQLTKLHIEHQELQFKYHQLLEKHNRELDEERANMNNLQAKIEELEDEVTEMRDTNKLQNSYLWRLISVASVASRGKAADSEDTTATVRGSQVDAAVKTLTTFVLSSLEKPPAVPESVDRSQKQQEQGNNTETTLTENRDDMGSHTNININNGGSDNAALVRRIEELELQLIARDAERDVIVDCKLKRMQNLVLRLHTTNAALVEEMRNSFALNEELFNMVDKHPKLGAKIAKAGLVPISLKAALERATLARVPTKPYGHN